MRATLLSAAVLAAGLAVSAPAFAADIAPLDPSAKVVESQSGWTFTASPYFCVAGISGNTAELVMAKPLVSAGMVAKTLEVTPQAARRIVLELGLREMTGMGRFRAWGIV